MIAIHHQVIAHQQRLLHRSGRNDEVLRQERKNEQPHHQHRADAGDRFKGRFFHVFLFGSRLDFGRRLGGSVFFLVILSLFAQMAGDPGRYSSSQLMCPKPLYQRLFPKEATC